MTPSRPTLLDSLVDLERRPDARAYTPVEYNLEGFRRWIAAMDNPQDRVPWIHIAGTKGKGSTAALCESILHAAGFSTGLYTSPHLAHYGQRYRLNTRDMTLDEFNEALARVEPLVNLREPDPHVPHNTYRTVFEVLTAIAFREFAAREIQAGVLEVGLGGRLDCTNLVTPVVSVITSIGLDHTKMLGNTVEEIAAEKAGIIKPGVPVVLFSSPGPAHDTILRIAAERNAPVHGPIRVESVGITDSGQRVAFMWRNQPVTADLPLLGEHQLRNLGLALRACELFLESGTLQSDLVTRADRASSIASGIAAVRWPGRFEILHGSPTVILDGAHCPLSATALGRTLSAWLDANVQRRNVHLVWGMQADKDHGAFLRALLGATTVGRISAVHCATVPGSRGASAESLTAVADSLGLAYTASPSVASAMAAARGAAAPDDVILVAGSLYSIESARIPLVIPPDSPHASP